MKALARGYVWWPCLDADIEDYVKGCHACINTYQVPKTTPLLLWLWATWPWQRVHVDFLEIKDQQFFLLVDSYSKQSPSRGPALRHPTFEPLPQAYFLGANLSPTHRDTNIHFH